MSARGSIPMRGDGLCPGGAPCSRGGEQGGFALVTVIVVLAALLVLCAPFLLSATHADRTSASHFERAQARVALDTAATHARTVLERSHPSLDASRDWDSLEELAVTNRFPEGFLDASDPTSVMWDVEAEDLAGRIDLDTANPQVIANMLGLTSRLVGPATSEDAELSISGATSLRPTGFVSIDGELVRYGLHEKGKLSELQRGLLAEEGTETAGFRPPSNHAAGTPVIDTRAFAPAIWRFATGDLRGFDSPEQLRGTREFTLDGEGLDADELARLAELGTVHVGLRSTRPWMRGMRLVRSVEGGVDGALTLDTVRWINEGATIRILGAGTVEHALVQRVSRGGTVYLDRPVAYDHRAFEAVVEVLAKRPVNVNVARPEVLEALFTNLQLRGRGDRITGSEAKSLAGLVVESRPFEGFEDFLRRVVLPAAGLADLPPDAPVRPAAIDLAQGGGALIDEADAWALYANALNANDSRLSFSTMPLSFTSRDVYRLDLRAAVHAPSGVERYSAVREEVRLVVPQMELLFALGRQEDFDEALRLTRDAAFWATGPNATTRHDSLGATPPPRFPAHVGREPDRRGDPEATRREHVFASRSENDWAQLAVSRVQDFGDLRGRVLHFDDETRDLEGRYLPDEPIRRATDDPMVRWVGNAGLMRALDLSLWVKPRSHAAATLLDVAGTSAEADRLSILFEGGDLVVRMLSAAGDHPATPWTEATEVRYALAAGDGPGLQADVWHHLSLHARGSRPDQIQLLVNGTAHGVRTPGLTRLASAVGSDTMQLPVESTEGFPPRGVARIGNELVEYELSGNGLRAQFHEAGPLAGFGGRNARVGWTGGAPSIPTNLATLQASHPAGTPVALYGYALPIQDDLPNGFAVLPTGLGAFRCAIAIGVEGGSETLGDPISISTVFGSFQVGYGMEGGTASGVTGLRLAPAEDPEGGGDPGLMAAFAREGGYAAVVQTRWGGGSTTDAGSQIAGVEIVRYSGWNGNVLQIAARGNQVDLPNLAGFQGGLGGGTRAFVANWTATAGGVPIQPRLDARTFVFPISVPVPGATALQGFLAADAENTRFAQLTRTQDEGTEWIAYDWFDTAQRQLVRDSPARLTFAYQVLTQGFVPDPDDPNIPTTPMFGGGAGAGAGAPASFGFAPPPPATAAAPAAAGAQWEPMIGQPTDLQYPITRELAAVLQHRGVHETYAQAHPAGTVVLPVFRVHMQPGSGRPGRFDHVFLVGPNYDHVGWPAAVHRGHVPSGVATAHRWAQPNPTTPVAADSGNSYSVVLADALGTQPSMTFVALSDRAPVPMVAGSVQGAAAGQEDTRAVTRLLLWPSGERPRIVAQAAIGGAVQEGASGGAVPAAVVDEIVFGDTAFGRNAPGIESETTQGGSLVVRTEMSASDETLEVFPRSLLVPLGRLFLQNDLLADLPQGGGLLRIGEEIMAYEQLDASSGLITLAANGRGLLGTEPQAHQPGEPVNPLTHLPASVLAAGLDASSGHLELASLEGFPTEGTVLLGNARTGNLELVHYTRHQGGGLAMPVTSREPGEMDGRGRGLFRGRYGTTPSAHAAGEPVILFPFRYWDRWSERADAPELSYFGFEVAQPGAFWRSTFFDEEQAGGGRARLACLLRLDPDVPWDADPGEVDGLVLLERGLVEGLPVPLNLPSDRPEWRVFVRYLPGAYDALTAMSHDWRTTPRLRSIGAFYLAPERVLRSVER